MILPVKIYGSEILRRKALPVEDFDGNLKKLVEDMAETMYKAPGIGLAAPQVGVSKRVFVADISTPDKKDKLYVLVNPEIVEFSEEKDKFEEGCLSIPGIYEDVVRPVAIKVKAQNLEGEDFTLSVEGLLARCFQHEIDHLNGILFVDRVSGFRKKLLKGKLKRNFGIVY